MNRQPSIDQAIERANQHLLAQAEAGFPETRHTMGFPRKEGFQAKQERHSSDVFARAVLASVLLDIRDLSDEDERFRETLRDIAHRESHYVARAKLKDRAGGWSYFPDLPELPPDLDSLSAALFLFARIAPEYTPLCDEPLRIALEGLMPDGSLNTWIIASRDAPDQQARMKEAVALHWGDEADVEVCARFFRALITLNHYKYQQAVMRGAHYVQEQQQPDGSWRASWYWGQAYGSSLCIDLLRHLGVGEQAQSRAERFFLASQRQNGGWGMWESVPLDTALSLWALGRSVLLDHPDVVERAVGFLLDFQAQDGRWNPSPWIRMEVGRAKGQTSHTLSYQSATLTTAFCLRSLLLVQPSFFLQERIA
jgi:squalene-hopene/tetraprenyl-beta-curcumene cyclase